MADGWKFTPTGKVAHYFFSDIAGLQLYRSTCGMSRPESVLRSVNYPSKDFANKCAICELNTEYH